MVDIEITGFDIVMIPTERTSNVVMPVLSALFGTMPRAAAVVMAVAACALFLMRPSDVSRRVTANKSHTKSYMLMCVLAVYVLTSH